MRARFPHRACRIKELAVVATLSYSRWEKGQAHPRTKQLAKIEEALRMGQRVAEKKIR